ncbi:hypothetical protein SO694_00007359 [Aureococcus anophagefferens]|uniref:Uncharacterized protein n=1 Tax=Aureococcus anophagefferens TaxID=44056 RepID=A0ABR1GB28_AURAN
MSRRTKCDPEKETSQLMYEARMQYVTGHVDASVSTQDTSIWTIQIPEHLKPRQKRRLEMKRAENKMKMMAEIAKQKRRSTFSQREGCALHSWKLTYQAGCWFWVDQVTGAATAAPPPSDQGSAQATLATSSWGRSSLDSESARRRARVAEGADESDSDAESDCDDVGPKESLPPCGTGHVYDSTEFNDFMRLLDKETGGKKGRKEIRPMTAPPRSSRPSRATRPEIAGR